MLVLLREFGKGISKPVISSQPIYRGSHFTWGEATRDGERLPIDTFYDGRWIAAATISSNIIRLANKLDPIRSQFGDKPIRVTSWLRSPATNQIIGGVRNSQHLLGWAADIQIEGYSPHEVAQTLDAIWECGLGNNSIYTHIDLRNLQGKGKARWDYGNA
jgi:hypothetical protein